MTQQPLMGQGLFIIEASRSHSDTPPSGGLLWTSDQPDEQPLPDNTQRSQQTDIHAPEGFEPANPARERPQTHALDGAATGVSILKCP
jgi:hypothetical protein